MPKIVIRPGDSEWKRLHTAWIEQGKKGYVVLPGGDQFRVLKPDDDTVLFEIQSGLDDMYASRSTRSVS